MDKQHLAVCHCRDKHANLFLFKKDGTKVSFKSDGLKDTIEYIDQSCPEETTTWEKIPANSKDYIWPIYCPIYMYLKSPIGNAKPLPDDEILRILLIDGWRVLKNNGKIIFIVPEGYENFDANVMSNSMLEWSKKNGNNPWKIEINNTSDLDFYVMKENSPVIHKQRIILTKIVSGGKRKTKKKHNKKRKLTRKRK